MCYEEKIINGVLMFRTGPDRQWHEFSASDVNTRIVYMAACIKILKHKVKSLDPRMPGIEQMVLELEMRLHAIDDQEMAAPDIKQKILELEMDITEMELEVSNVWKWP